MYKERVSDKGAALRFTWRLGNKASLILEAVVSVLKVNVKGELKQLL